MDNVAIIIVLALIFAFAVGYIVRAKKKGAKCIGCPSGSKCSGNCCSCGNAENETTDHTGTED